MPFSFTINTPRLILRPFEKTDITDSYLSWLNDPIVTQFSNQRFIKHTFMTSLAYFESFENTSNTFLLLFHIDACIPIGTMYVARDLRHGTADVALMLGDRRHWRLGLGLEAWQAVLNHLHSESFLRKITAGTARTNVGMLRIFEKSGMSLEAVRYQQEVIDSCPTDLNFYSKFT